MADYRQSPPVKTYEAPHTKAFELQEPAKLSGWYKARKYTVDELWESVEESNVSLLERCLKAGLSADRCRLTAGTYSAFARQKARARAPKVHALIDLAVENGNLAVVRLLLRSNADLTGSAAAAYKLRVDASSKPLPNDSQTIKDAYQSWTTPLHRAALNDNVEIMEVLVDEGNADLNVMDPRFMTPLHSAMHGQSLSAAKFLIDRGASVDAAEAHGITALAMCGLNGNMDLAKLVIPRSATMNTQDMFGETPLFNAAVGGHTPLVRLLVASGADPDIRNIKGISAFFSAASTFNIPMMDTLVNCGADVDSKDSNGCTALIRAAMAKNHALVKYLLRYGCNLQATDDDDWTALEAAMISGDEDTILLLLTYGAAEGAASSSSSPTTTLHHAATHGCTAAARFLLRPNQSFLAQINARDDDDDTALILAASHNHVGILRHLLRSGASHTLVNPAENTALEHAVYWGNYSCCLELVRAGATFKQATFDALACGRADHDSVMHSTSPQRRRGDRTLDFDAITKRFVPEGLTMPPYAGRSSGGASPFARSIDPTPRMHEKQGKPPVRVSASSDDGTSAATGSAAASSPAVATSTAGPLQSVLSSESTNSAAAGGVLLSPPATRTSMQSTSSADRSSLRIPSTSVPKQEPSPDPFEACIPVTRLEQIIIDAGAQQTRNNSDLAGAVANTANGVFNLIGAIAGAS